MTFTLTDNLFSMIFHALFLFIALSSLYVFVISKMEQDVFKNEIGNKIKDILPDKLKEKDIDGILKKTLKDNEGSLKKLQEYYDKPEKETEIYNTGLTRMMILIIVIFIVSIILPYIFLKITCNYNVPLGSIILENIMLFIFIGGFELFFFLKIASKYVPTEPSTLVNRIIQDINNYSSLTTKR